MKQVKINRGTLPPLFDRIVDDKNSGRLTKKLLNEKEVRDSIIEELSIILNTRCTVRRVIYDDHIATIPLFGLPDFFGLGDFSNFDGTNPQDWPRATRLIETAIQAAEPRVTNVRVHIEKYLAVDQSLSLTISAKVKGSHLLKEIHFPLALSLKATSSPKSRA